VFGGVHQLEGDAFTVPAGRKTPAFDDRDLVRHIRVLRIMRDPVYAGFRHDLTGLIFLGHRLLLYVVDQRTRRVSLYPFRSTINTRAMFSVLRVRR
jgi:hypothetical protein